MCVPSLADEGNNQTEDGEVNALEYEDQNLGVTEPEEEFKLPENLSIENEDGQQEDEELSGSGVTSESDIFLTGSLTS